MRKALICLLCLFFLLGSVHASAADLPIDIGAIGHISGETIQRDEFTTRQGIELFSADAEAINTAMAEQARQWRESAEGGLFQRVLAAEEPDAGAHVLYTAVSLELFSAPTHFGRGTEADTPEGLPLRLIVLLFISGAAGAFFVARILAEKKERKRHVSHTYD